MKHKKLLLTAFFLLGLVLSGLQAQSYQIIFTGSGQSTTVDSVQVLNLTQGTSLTLKSGDGLNLVGSSTGIDAPFSGEVNFRVYPNPSVETSKIQFFNSKPGQANLEIFDVTGKLFLRENQHLTVGYHTFEVEGLRSGIYLVNVVTSGGKFSGNLMSAGESIANSSIRYLSNDITSSPKHSLKSTQNLVEMAYNDGERLKLTGMSGVYARVMTVVPTENKTIDFEFVTCSDADQNHYPVVKIGTQTWMAENLRSTKYNNETAIPNVQLKDSWQTLSTHGYCWYNNDPANKDPHGALYNGFVMETGNPCPTGWHIPTNAEWEELVLFVSDNGHSAAEGAALKATSSWDPATGNGNDAFGFTAYGVGFRFNAGANDFGFITKRGGWWTSTQTDGDPTKNVFYHLQVAVNTVVIMDQDKKFGLSVRCIKD